MGAASELRRQLADGFPVAPGCFDALSAKIAVRAGFPVVHVTGYGVAATQYGVPDIGLLGFREVIGQAERVIQAVDVPVICDVDAGFGGVAAVTRTVQAFERLGSAGVHIEDQADPKRCPALDGRDVISIDDFTGKIRAACEARVDPDFLIIARSDADEIGFDDLVERANAYLAAGADMVMPMLMKVEGVRIETLAVDEQIMWHRRLVEAIDGPVLGLTPPAGRTVLDMHELGYAALLLTLVGLRAAANAMFSALLEARQYGTADAYFARQSGDLQSHGELMELLGLAEFEAVERRHSHARQ